MKIFSFRITLFLAIVLITGDIPCHARMPGFILQGEVAVGQNKDQRLFCFARGTDNNLWYTEQCTVAGAWNNVWVSLGGPVTGNIAIVSQPNKVLFAFAKGLDNKVRYIFQTVPGSSTWSAWGIIPDSTPITISGDIAVLRYQGNLLLLGRETASNQIVCTCQKENNNPTSWNAQWLILGNYITNPMVGDRISAFEKSDGSVSLFAPDKYNASVWHFNLNTYQSITHSWENLGGSVCGDIGVEENSFGTVEIFAATGPQDRSLWHNWQQWDGSWAGWRSLTKSNTVFNRIAVGKNADGRLDVAVCGYRGALQHIWQLHDCNWSELSDFNETQIMDTCNIGIGSFFSDTNRRLFVVAKSNCSFENDVAYTYQTDKNGTWTNWNKMNVAFYDNFENVTVGFKSPKWTSVCGTWNAIQPNDHTKEYTASIFWDNTATAGDKTWTNYSVQASVYFCDDANGGVCLLGRVQSTDTYYEAELKKDDNGNKKWWLWKRVYGQWILLGSGYFNYVANMYYHLRLDMGVNGASPGFLTVSISTDYGTTFSVLGSVYDTTPLLYGKIGIRSWMRDARFDEILVRLQ